jgi:hypothetical protein
MRHVVISRQEARERKRESNKRWYAANAESVRARAKRWRVENPERYRESQKQWRLKNADHHKRWRRANQKRRSEYNRLWHAAHQEKSPGYSYSPWWGMIQRCEDPNNISFKNYGGRTDDYGNPDPVTVCDEWRYGNGEKSGYELYREYIAQNLGPKPGPGYTLDRIKNAIGYRPGNLHWANWETQAANRRPPRKRLVTHCPSGHEYTPENTRFTAYGRVCRACHRKREAERRCRNAKARERSRGRAA